mgnify:CR=1 FL=1
MKLDVPHSLITELRELARELPEAAVFAKAPGRVEILGNHTDYNGGLVLATTIERYVWALGVAEEIVSVKSVAFDETVIFDHHEQARSLGNHWDDYVRGVFWALERRGLKPRGMAAVVDGDVPLEAGLSSSAALEVAIVNLVARLSGLKMSPKSLAMIAFEAERLFCGVSCGIMDQFTSQLCRPDSLLAIHCANMQTIDLPLPPDITILVIDSGVSRPAGEALNERRAECDRATNTLRKAGWNMSNLGQLGVEQLRSVADILDPVLVQRVEHVVRENERVRRGIDLLRAGEISEFGRLMYESHDSSRDLFEVSHPNLDLLVAIAKEQRDVIGARLTGAGMGGSIVVLTRGRAAQSVARTIQQAYEQEVGLAAEVIVTGIPGGVRTADVRL